MEVRELIEQLQEIDSLGLTSLTDEQREMLKNTHNTYVSFDYGKDGEGNFIIVTGEDSYNRLNYYMGFEYIDDEDIHLLVRTHGLVVLKVDQDNERMENFFASLDSVEKEG